MIEATVGGGAMTSGRSLRPEGGRLVSCVCSSFVPIPRDSGEDAGPSCLVCGKAPPTTQNVGPANGTREDGSLTVQVEQAGDALIVRVVGELSRSTAETFDASCDWRLAVTPLPSIWTSGAWASSTPRAFDRCSGSGTIRFGTEVGFECGVHRRPSNKRSSGVAWSVCCRWWTEDLHPPPPPGSE